MREAFEKWAVEEIGYSVERLRCDDSVYKEATTRRAWLVWKACWEYRNDNH